MKYLLVFFFVVAINFPALSMGMQGTYIIKGTATLNDSALRNTTLYISVANKKWQIQSDSMGVFTMKIAWKTPCLSGYFPPANILRKVQDSLNPPIHIRYGKHHAILRNEWRTAADFMEYRIRKPVLYRTIVFH